MFAALVQRGWRAHLRTLFTGIRLGVLKVTAAVASSFATNFYWWDAILLTPDVGVTKGIAATTILLMNKEESCIENELPGYWTHTSALPHLLVKTLFRTDTVPVT